MMASRNNQIAIAVALILLLGTVVVYFSLGQSGTVDVLPSGENELLSLAQESGRLSIFVANEIYDESFFNIDNLKIPENQYSVDHAYHLYPLQINFEKLPINKPEFFDRMKHVGINLQVHYIPVHLQPFYQNNYKNLLQAMPR